MLVNQIGNKKRRTEKAISIIEILVVIAIIGVTLMSILSLMTLALRASLLIKESVRANSLTQEAIEGVRTFRDGVDWDNDDIGNQYDGLGVVGTGIAYHLEKSTDDPPQWILIQGEESIDIFTRKIVFEDVYRDNITDDIVTSGGYLDNDTKKITVTVFWKNKEVEIVTYLTNWPG